MKLIPLSTAKNTIKNFGFSTQVDDADFDWLNQWRWCAVKDHNTYYAARTIRTEHGERQLRMHRLILGLTDPKQLGEHKDGNGLNNQRLNLRTATHSQNMKNRRPKRNGTSKFLGVDWHKRSVDGKPYYCWRATIKINGKKTFLGSFKKEEDAALAYNKVAKIHHGEFANLNIITPPVVEVAPAAAVVSPPTAAE